MALTPKKVPAIDIIRKVKEVVDYNADLQIVDWEETDTGFNLLTPSGEKIAVDLTAKFMTRQESLENDSVPQASETKSGRIPIVTQSEAEKGEDDTAAMTALKTVFLLLKWGIPKFNLDGAKAKQALNVSIDSDGNLTIIAEDKPGSPSLQDVLIKGPVAKVAPLFYGGFGALVPDEPNGSNCKILVVDQDGAVYKRTTASGGSTDPVPTGPVITYAISSHQVEIDNLVAVDFEVIVSTGNPSFFDVVTYVASTVDIVESVSITGDTPYNQVLNASGNYGIGYTRRGGILSVPAGYSVTITGRYQGSSTVLYSRTYTVPNTIVARSVYYQASVVGARTRLTLQRTTTPATGSPVVDTVYFLLSPGGDCAADDSTFSALTSVQKAAQVTAAEPAPLANKHWQTRDCGSGGSYVLTGDLIAGGDDNAEQSNDSLNPVLP